MYICAVGRTRADVCMRYGSRTGRLTVLLLAECDQFCARQGNAAQGDQHLRWGRWSPHEHGESDGERLKLEQKGQRERDKKQIEGAKKER